MSTRHHLHVLDGLRGTAAFGVVLYHYQSVTTALQDPNVFWPKHAHLAVDFFFCLSGYVIALAYSHRIADMGLGSFLRVRLIRLHPMVLIGTLLGLLAYVVDPFTFDSAIPAPFRAPPEPAWKVAAASVAGALMLPSWPLPQRLNSYFPLNGPAWSLMWEYVANIAYGLFLWRLGTRALIGATLIAAIGLAVVAFQANGLNVGWGWGQEFAGLARVGFSFLCGMLLRQLRWRLQSPLGFGWLSLALALLFVGPPPSLGVDAGVYEAAAVLFAFPLIVALGAGATARPTTARICDLSGRLSYPIYLINFPVTMLLMGYYWTHHDIWNDMPMIFAVLTGMTVMAAYLILRFYDEPVRRWLQSRLPSRSITPSSTPALVPGD